jgi:hypothetical protein
MLILLTLAYLALPYFIFAWGWLRWPYAVVFSAVILLTLALVGKSQNEDKPAPSRFFRGKYDLLAFIVVTLLVFLPCGVGGIGYQRADWLKHNCVLHDLSTSPWPTSYESNLEGEPSYYLTYYIAYYLPAAGVGRVLGLTAAHLTLFVWTLAGLVLCGGWVIRLVQGRGPLIWACWFALSGMEVLGIAVSGALMEWWSGYWVYSSNMSLLAWVPQHALSGWLASALIVYFGEQKNLSLVGFAAALTALWSPFVTLGLVPLGIVLMLRTDWRSGWPTICSFSNFIAAPVILFISVTYLGSGDAQEVPHGVVFQLHPGLRTAALWLLFCLVEFGIYAALLAPDLFRGATNNERGRWTRDWFVVAVVVLSILPCYVVGKLNDLTMRASIPCQFVFWVVLLRTFVSGHVRLGSWRGRLLVGCLFLGALLPAKQWLSQVAQSRPALRYRVALASESPLMNVPPKVSVAQLPEEYLHQYMGRGDSVFFRYLAARAEKK